MQKEHRSQRASCMSCTAQHIHLLLIKESLIYGFQSSHLKRWCGSLGMTKDWYHPLDLSVPLLAIYCLPIMLHVYTGIIDAPFNPCLFLGLPSLADYTFSYPLGQTLFYSFWNSQAGDQSLSWWHFSTVDFSYCKDCGGGSLLC